jgi:hypothetical protein
LVAPGVASIAARAPDAAPSPAPIRDVQRAPLVGKAPPELRADAGDWLSGTPATLVALKGKAVWLQFNF